MLIAQAFECEALRQVFTFHLSMTWNLNIFFNIFKLYNHTEFQIGISRFFFEFVWKVSVSWKTLKSQAFPLETNENHSEVILQQPAAEP